MLCPVFPTVADGAGDISDGADLYAGCSGSPHLYFSYQTVSLWTQEDPLLHPGVSPKTEGLKVQYLNILGNAKYAQATTLCLRNYTQSDLEAGEEATQQILYLWQI